MVVYLMGDFTETEECEVREIIDKSDERAGCDIATPQMDA